MCCVLYMPVSSIRNFPLTRAQYGLHRFGERMHVCHDIFWRLYG